jgi:hypothetical protein
MAGAAECAIGAPINPVRKALRVNDSAFCRLGNCDLASRLFSLKRRELERRQSGNRKQWH